MEVPKCGGRVSLLLSASITCVLSQLLVSGGDLAGISCRDSGREAKNSANFLRFLGGGMGRVSSVDSPGCPLFLPIGGIVEVQVGGEAESVQGVKLWTLMRRDPVEEEVLDPDSEKSGWLAVVYFRMPHFPSWVTYWRRLGHILAFSNFRS